MRRGQILRALCCSMVMGCGAGPHVGTTPPRTAEAGVWRDRVTKTFEALTRQSLAAREPAVVLGAGWKELGEEVPADGSGAALAERVAAGVAGGTLDPARAWQVL